MQCTKVGQTARLYRNLRVSRHFTCLRHYSAQRISPSCITRVVCIQQVSLCVEGNIGSGKSTFLKDVVGNGAQLKELACTIPEPVQSWQHIQRKRPGKPHNLLREFYANPQKYGYVFQNYIFMTRFLQQQGTLNSTKKLRIMERSVFSDRNVFVESAQENGWLSELEFDLFNSWFCPMVNALPNLVPDGFIYLRVEHAVCLQRLRHRARGEELSITSEYLESLHEKHENWLSQETQDVLVGGEILRIGFAKDTVCGRYTKKPVLVLDFGENIDFSAGGERVEQMRKKVLAFYDFLC